MNSKRPGSEPNWWENLGLRLSLSIRIRVSTKPSLSLSFYIHTHIYIHLSGFCLYILSIAISISISIQSAQFGSRSKELHLIAKKGVWSVILMIIYIYSVMWSILTSSVIDFEYALVSYAFCFSFAFYRRKFISNNSFYVVLNHNSWADYS